MRRRLAGLIVIVLLTSCTGAPKGIEPVTGFEPSRYLGTWYEIARLDHSFEEGLERVTAQYRRRADGGIDVSNRGWLPESGEWQEAEGKAYFVEDESVGHLKVSFFGPFYGAYVVWHLDPQYRYAFVAGYSRNYLWLLARQPTVSEALKSRFLDEARRSGFDTSGLIWVDQAR